jgi:CRP/FNR family cyclic AMP-dependent transcriptional regulator
VARFRQDTKIAALARSPLFEGLSRKQLAQLARLTDDLDVPAGTVLCKEGTTGREFFVVLEGEAVVARDGKEIARIEPGGFFGEIALLERVVRTATVTAATNLRFFVVADQAFASLVHTDPSIERKLLRTLARRALAPQDPSLA